MQRIIEKKIDYGWKRFIIRIHFVSSITFYHTGTVLFYLVLKYSYPVNMYIMILSIMYYFTNFGDLCDSGSFHLYGFPGSTTHYDKKFILLLLTSFISEIKLFLFLFLFLLRPHALGHNRTNGAVYSKINFKVEICSVL